MNWQPIVKKLSKADADITNDDDVTRDRKYHAYYGWPGVFIMDGETRLKITKASHIDNVFTIETIVPAGKNEMAYCQYLENKK